MSETLAELLRRLPRSEHFRWMPGMLCSQGRVLTVSIDPSPMVEVLLPEGIGRTSPNWIAMSEESMDDAATMGCLVKLARDRLANEHWFPECVRDATGTHVGWRSWMGGPKYETLPHCIVGVILMGEWG